MSGILFFIFASCEPLLTDDTTLIYLHDDFSEMCNIQTVSLSYFYRNFQPLLNKLFIMDFIGVFVVTCVVFFGAEAGNLLYCIYLVRLF